MKEMRKARKTPIVVLTTLLVIILSVLVAFSITPAKNAEALTTANIANAVHAGGQNQELWDGYSFNPIVINDLRTKLFGTEDPVNYIKTNGADDYNKYGKNSPNTAERGTPYYVVPASTINTKVGNATNGMVVQLGGKNWMVASLTLDNDENVVMTLYLADQSGTYRYNSSTSTAKAYGAYSRSDLRIHLKTDANWSLYNSDFASKFLVKPKNVLYQHTESLYGRPDPPWGTNYNGQNDALGTLPSNWASSSYTYQPSETFTNANNETVRYDAWGEDYIWIPSVTETGYSNRFTTNSGSIWRLTAAQLSNSNSTGVYIRTTGRGSGADIWMIGSAGTQLDTKSPNSQYGVRPAIHLNFSAAELAVGTLLDNPENVTTTYNGDVQTLKDAYTAKPTEMAWYNKEWYEHTGDYIAITPETELKNAGTHWVKVEITQNWVDAVNAQVATEGAANGWSDAQIAEAKASRKPKFKGDPVTEDGHEESSTVRWFKFTIDPKELTVNKPSYNTGQFTAPSFANLSELSGFSDVPTLATRFTGTILADSSEYNEIDIIPTRRGTYTAQAILVNSPTDKTEYSGGNFVIKNASTINCEIKVNRSRLTIPTIAESNKTYTGKEIRFSITGYDTDWRNVATLIVPEGMRIEGDDSNGWELVATEAGTYTITAAIKSEQKSDWCWNTDNATQEIIEDRAINVTIGRKTLFVDFISSSGAFLMQKGAEVSFSVQPSNAVEGDDVKISLEYYKPSDNTTAISVPSGILDASTLEEAGTYQLRAVLNDSAAADNKNYVLDVSMLSQNFTISARQISIETVNWQYTQNSGLPVAIAESAGLSASDPAIVVYNGSTFVFSLGMNAATLASAGVKVDATFGVNGYKNGLLTNATDNAVEITVRLIPLNEEYAFNDAGGNPLDNQYKDFTVYVKVNKADIDFSKLVWSADELEYTAQPQEVTIVSGLPDFLNVEYYDNSKTNVGEYTAGVMSLRVRDLEASKNYNVPSTVTGIAPHDWKIVKKKINITWIDSEEPTGEGDTVIFIPTLADDEKGAIQYRYYAAEEGVMPPTPDLTKVLTFNDILNYDQTEYKYYFVCAYIKAPSGSEVNEFNSDNTVFLIDGAEATEAYQAFRLGGNKNPVIVRLLKENVVYNGEVQAAQIEVDSGGQLTDSDYTITYKEVLGQDGEGNDIYGTPMRDAPSDAGKYIVVVTINKSVSETYAIKGEREFTYTIEKADFDTSEMKWVDVMNGNAEYTGAYMYNPNATHKLEFVGTPKFDGQEVLGVRIVCTPEVGDGIGTAVGTYKVLLSFEFDNEALYSGNFNIPKNEEFVWEIEKCSVDLSGVTWNYNDKPFVFSIVDGEAVKYSARLVFPEGFDHLQSLIIYSGDNGEYSDVGVHTTGFTVTDDPEILKNYDGIVFSELLERELDWEIAPLKVPKAQQVQKVTFRGQGYTLGDVTNLPLDFAQYFDVVVYDPLGQEVPQTDGTWNFFDNGRYRIQISFKAGMNRSVGGKVDNVKWGDNSRGPYQIVLTIDKLIFAVNGWTEDPEGYARPELDVGGDDGLLAEIKEYFDFILKKQSDGTIIEDIDSALENNTYYSIALKLKEEYKGNVLVNYNNEEVEETAPYVFKTKDSGAVEPIDFYEKPTGDALRVRYEYTGEEITFALGSWFVPLDMEVISGELNGTEIGEYPVTVGFRSGSPYAWGNEEVWDRTPVTAIFEIYDKSGGGKFILTDEAAASHPYKFQYGDFSELSGDISDYVYTPETALYITRLALNDTIAQLLAQFANGESIKVFAVSGTEITDYTKVLMTGIMLRLVDGETVLNQLTVSVLGDVNGDGKINTIDKAQQNSLTLGTKELGAAEKLACDINADGKVNTIDKARLNSQSLGTIDIYEGLRLSAPAARTVAVVIAEELDEPTTASVVEPIAEEIEVVAVEEYEPVSESDREMPTREPISAAVVIADTRRLRVKF